MPCFFHTPATPPSKQTTAAVTISDTAKLQPTADRLIVQGESVGQTKVEEEMPQVLQRLGKPDAGNAAMGKALNTWYSHHDTSSYQTAIFSSRPMGTGTETSHVKQIRITSPWFTTRNDLHVGSTLQALQAHHQLIKKAWFTKGRQRFDLYDTQQGIRFEVNQQNVCTGIVVYNPNDKNDSSYLPFYTNLKTY